MADGTTIFHICVTCRGGAPEHAPAAGQALYDALAQARPAEAALALRPAACLANCTRGCSAALAGPGKWTYLLGHLSPALAGDLLLYAATYAASATGTVMPSRRPASLRDVVIGRVPAALQGAAA